MSTSSTSSQGPPTSIETRLFINGSFVPSQTGKKFPVINPATEKLTASVYEAEAVDVDLAVAAAQAAFPAWSAKGAWDRAQLFFKLATLLEGANSELARLEAVSMGRPVSQYVDGFGAARLLRYYAGKAADVQGESSLNTPGFVNLTLRQPFGVCGLIIPWNAPISTLMVKLAPCLIAGNAVVVKTSEKAPLTGLLLARLIQEAGFPPGVVNILSGMGPVCGAAIASHMEIRKVAFTGSVRTGRAIKKAAADSNLKKVSLELGGKSPLIIFEDADLEKAIPAAAASIVTLSGQMCIASSRVYVQSSIADEFSKRLVREIELKGSNTAGNDPLSPATVRGPQVDKLQFDSIMGHLKEAKEAGYQILTGGDRDGDVGYYIQPTVILNADENSRAIKEEIFGPVQCLSVFESEEEVLRWANDTEFGLYASVYTKDISRALRVAKGFEAGTVAVNTTSPMVAMDMPFGGWKSSGEGRELGPHALDAWTEIKTVLISL